MTALQLPGCSAQLDLTSDRPQEAYHLAGIVVVTMALAFPAIA